MINIGIIGSQSIHSEEFSKICNIPNQDGNYLIPDCRISAICGVDDCKEHTKIVAQRGNISRIVKTPDELFDDCDAVMILTRNGENHIKYALPFIEKRYPVFIDKPICITDSDISILKKSFEKYGGIITGGSGMKHCQSVKEIKKMIDSGELGEIHGISINHNADINCEYGGIFFYACHAVEMMIMLLGEKYNSVETSVFSHNTFSAMVKYDKQFANLIFTNTYNGYFINVYGEKKNISYKIDASDIFKNTLIDFADKISNGIQSEGIEELIYNVYIMQDIDVSLKCETEKLVR